MSCKHNTPYLDRAKAHFYVARMNCEG